MVSTRTTRAKAKENVAGTPDTAATTKNNNGALLKVTPSPTRAHFKDFQPEKAAKLLKKAVLIVSVGINRHEGEYLKSTIDLIREHQDMIQEFDVLLGGSLHRWDYWNFCRDLNKNELKELLKDIPANLTVEELALTLAQTFYPLAKQAEQDYISTNAMTYLSNLPGKFHIKFIPWESMVSIPYGTMDKSDNAALHNLQQTYAAELRQQYSTDKKFADNFRKTRDRLLKSQAGTILVQGQRIKAANSNLSHFTDAQLNEVASICSLNYLFEEAPVLGPMMADNGYTASLYPGPAPEAIVAVREFYKSKAVGWMNVHHQKESNNGIVCGLSTKISTGTSPSSSAAISSLLTSRSQSGIAITVDSLGPVSVKAKTSSPASQPLPMLSHPITNSVSADDLSHHGVSTSPSSNYSDDFEDYKPDLEHKRSKLAYLTTSGDNKSRLSLSGDEPGETPAASPTSISVRRISGLKVATFHEDYDVTLDLHTASTNASIHHSDSESESGSRYYLNGFTISDSESELGSGFSFTHSPQTAGSITLTSSPQLSSINGSRSNTTERFALPVHQSVSDNALRYRKHGFSMFSSEDSATTAVPAKGSDLLTPLDPQQREPTRSNKAG